MSKAKSLWSTADSFLTKTRKFFLNAVTVLLLILVTISIFGIFGSFFTEEEKINPDGKVLWFKPIGVVVDNAIDASPSIEDFLSNNSVTQHEIDDLLEVLNHAANDENLEAIYVNVSELGMYYATAFQIANAVKNIKDNGKRVIAYAENYGNNSYLISSQASDVMINNYGSVAAFGFARKREYYKDLYKNIKLNYNVFVAGDFKSGPEPFTRTSMSDEDKLAWNEFANPLWKKMTSMIESSRNLKEGTMQDYGNNFWEMSVSNPERAQIALEMGLVDKIVTREDLRHWMFEEFPNEKGDKNRFPDSISIYDYLSLIEEEENDSKNKIAVVNVEGAITTGEATYNVAGSDTIVRNIRNAIKDEDVKALVLRVNSPGGSVWASELITNALNEFKETDRPIISSMGDIAASGGVWVTTLSDEIWARPETLTGSIGVYGLVPTLDGIYDWAGIQVDGTSSTKAAEWDNRLPMPDYVSNSIQASIDNSYDKFVSKVSENRSMPYKEILAVAGGRIWSGEKALELGLIDKIGDIDDAIQSAASLAEIDDFKVIQYSKALDPFEIFLAELLDNLDVKLNLNKNLIKIYEVFNSDYLFIDKDKDINIASYCFQCEFFEVK